MSKINPIEAVILAGGQSRRMGEDKARLLVGRRSLLAVSYTHLTLPTTPYV